MGALYDEIIDEKPAFPTSLLFTMRMIQIFSARDQKACRATDFIPVRGGKLLSPKKEIRIVAENLLLYFQVVVRVYVAETPTRVILTTFSSGNLRALKLFSYSRILSTRQLPSYTKYIL